MVIITLNSHFSSFNFQLSPYFSFPHKMSM